MNVYDHICGDFPANYTVCKTYIMYCICMVLADPRYVPCTYGILSKSTTTIHTVIYAADTRFWPRGGKLLGLARTIYIVYIQYFRVGQNHIYIYIHIYTVYLQHYYGWPEHAYTVCLRFFGSEITKFTVKYGVYI
jgi:hypothetical protein